MSTDAADLRAAAEIYAKHGNNRQGDDQKTAWTDTTEERLLAAWAAQHILATVHADDTDPVTPAFCEAHKLRNISHDSARKTYHIAPAIHLVANQISDGVYGNCDLWLGAKYEYRLIEHPTVGDIRHLFAALRMGGAT